MWLARTLNRCHGVHVEHEPVPTEQVAHREAMDHPDRVRAYIERFRLKEIYLRLGASRKTCSVYGEVNGCLRLHIEELRAQIPHVQIVHIVRDGRDVVRSQLSRNALTSTHPVYGGFRPVVDDDENVARWDTLTDLEKSAWLWSWDNRFLRERVSLRARFEDITTSYVLFKKQILEPLALDMDEECWSACAHRPENRTTTHTEEPWTAWSDQQKERFHILCGEEMMKYGYGSIQRGGS